MMKNILFVLLVLLSAQAKSQKMELGKVSIAELEQKEHPTDPSAPAAILFRKGQVNFDYSQQNGFVMTTTVKTRIKIYKKEGYEWANQQVDYYSYTNDSREKVSFSDAVTYNLADGKIVKSKLKSDGEFEEKINKYWSSKKITMPNVKEGSVIEYEYTVFSPTFGKLKDWDFQASIPVNYSEFKTAIPEYFIYKSNQKGYIFPKITQERVPNSFILTTKESGVGNGSSQEKIEYMEDRLTYVAENLPALKDEAFVNNIENYISSVSHELSMTKYPNSPIKSYSADWESVTKTIYDNDDFGPELNKTGYFEQDIDALIAGKSNPNEKTALIFDYVKANVKWDKFNGYSCNSGVRKAYKEKSGNAAEINLMLTAMLRYVGINANPVLISTRSNGIALFPNRTAFNYVITAIEITEGVVLLDATDKYSSPNILPLRDLNWYGRLIRKDGTSANIDLTPKTASAETVNMMYSVSDNGEITGKIRKQLTNHYALSFRQNSMGMEKESYLEALENQNDKIEISDYIRENDKELSKAITETYSFKAAKGVEVIGDKIYLDPLLFLGSVENPFKQEKREYPVDFGYPMEDKYNISITIPDGYAIETLPAGLNLSMEDDLGNFKYLVAGSGNKLQVSVVSTINQAIVGAEYYDTIKNFYQKMADKENEKIILKKI